MADRTTGTPVVSRRRAPLIGLVLSVIACVVIPVFVQSPYYLNLFIFMGMQGALAIGFNLMLRVKLLNLGIAAFWGLGAYISAVLTGKFHLSFWLSLPVSAIATGAVTLLIAAGLVSGGAGTFTFVLLCAVIGMIFTAAVGSFDFLGGNKGFSHIPAPDAIKLPGLPAIDFSSTTHFYYLMLVLLVIVVIAVRALNASSLGRSWTAIGMNSRLASSVGVNVARDQMVVFAITSVIAGLMGSFYAAYMGFISPTTFGVAAGMNVQVAGILGGAGSLVFGPLLGAIVMVALPQAAQVAPEVGTIITGVLLILLIIFLPMGVVGIFDRQSATAQAARAVMTRTLGRLGLRKTEEEKERVTH